jgi:hypothetical protein
MDSFFKLAFSDQRGEHSAISGQHSAKATFFLAEAFQCS